MYTKGTRPRYLLWKWTIPFSFRSIIQCTYMHTLNICMYVFASPLCATVYLPISYNGSVLSEGLRHTIISACLSVGEVWVCVYIYDPPICPPHSSNGNKFWDESTKTDVPTPGFSCKDEVDPGDEIGRGQPVLSFLLRIKKVGFERL